MWKWILIAASAGLLLLILWPYLFPVTSTTVISPVTDAELGAGWTYTDANNNQVTAYGTQAVQITQNTGIAATAAPALLNVNAGGKL